MPRTGRIPPRCRALSAQQTVDLSAQNFFLDILASAIRATKILTSLLEPGTSDGTLAQDGLLVKALPVRGDDL
jgi:hypothetical protein